MDNDEPKDAMADYSLDDWEKALTMEVGACFVCHLCDNRVMVTRGGVGVLDLVCCGHTMEKICSPGSRL